ncbi:MAG TPA: MFS transporter [Thermodesulfobacteriota bacterium]|nr:MFS transporter [Thermodesulfobacteriota bacterium]
MDQPEFDSKKRTRFDWWLGGICASRVFNGFIFMTYAGALFVLRREWDMSAAQAGAIATAFQIAYAISLVVFSTLADRVSPKKLYLWSMFSAGVSSMAFAQFARDFTSALLLHSVVGITLGGTYITGVMILADQYATRSRGMALGFFIASTSCGYALSLAISGIALPIGGYKLAFLLTCLGPIIGWPLAWITLRNTEIPAAVRKKGQRFTREVLKNRPAMLLIWGYTFHNWELLGMWSWTPAFLATCVGLAGSAALKAAGSGAYLTAFFHLMGLLASFSMGSLSDRLGRARVMIFLSSISAICSFVYGWSIGWPIAVVLAIGMVYAFSSLGDSPILSAALTESVDTAYMGSAFGLRSLMGFTAGAIAPLAFGAILDWTNPSTGGERLYTVWGWAFGMLGLGGLGAVLTVRRFGRISGR